MLTKPGLNFYIVYINNGVPVSMSQAIGKDGAVVDALRARRQVILDNVRDNDEAGVNYQKVVIHVLGLIRITFCESSYHINNFSICRKSNQMRSIDANSKI